MPLISAQELRALLDRNRGRVVLLNFWATFCAPCIKEIPELVKLERELGPQGFTLVGVALDEPSDRTVRVEPFRAKYFPDFPTYLRGEPDMDALVSAVDAAWNEILPTSYVIGRDGKVVHRIQGGKSYEAFRAAVLPALGGG
jgi:thiol-disulfide isomerase/thioredoxin